MSATDDKPGKIISLSSNPIVDKTYGFIEIKDKKGNTITLEGGGGSGTIYTFMTLDDTAKLTWFAPVYADPGFKEGEVLKIRAKVKRHEDDETYGKATIVTYVERVE